MKRSEALSSADRRAVTEHMELVRLTIVEILRKPNIDGKPAGEVVESRYAGLRPQDQLIATHDEPFDVAFDIAGLPKRQRRAYWDRSKQAYEQLVKRTAG
jgi:hypothetical protein